MSDISINVSFSNDTSQRRTVTHNQKRKNKKFRKKQQYLEQRRNLESKHTPTHSGQSGYGQTPLHNGASTKHPPLLTSTQHKSLLCPDMTTSASHCSSGPSASTCTLPSWGFTVKSKGSHEKPKEPVNTKSATTTSTSEVNNSLPHPSSSASASHFSSGPSASTRTLPSWGFTVKSKGSHEKPKEPVNTKSATTTSTSEVNNSLPHPSSSASASHFSPGPSASTRTLPSWAFTVNTKGSHEKPKEPVNIKSASTNPGPSASSSHKLTKTPGPSASSSHKLAPTKYLAIDCEMVGTGPKGSISQLARCSIVSYEGDVVYDKFINPSMPVTDYRTRWSGIRRSDLIKATPYAQARKEILKVLMGKVVVGHAVHNDFKVLSYTHPAALTRDTSRIPLLNLKAGFVENECASLKRLTKAIFNRDIQTGKKGHSSVEDARATMELYKVVEEEWERSLASKSQSTQ